MSSLLTTPVGGKSETDPIVGAVNGIVQANGAGVISAATTTGSGKVVLDTSPTIVTPTIASHVNAGHNHQDAAGGGALSLAAIADYNDHSLALYNALGSEVLAETMGVPVTMINGTQALTNQLCFFMAVLLRKPATITGLKWYQSVAGDYTANDYNGIGLYSYSGGTLTLRASSTNDGNIWKATSNTIGSKAFSSTYAANAGVYVVAMLWNRSAVVTTPTVGKTTAVINAAVMGLDFTHSAKVFGTIAFLTALPSPTQLMSGIGAGTQPIWVALY